MNLLDHRRTPLWRVWEQAERLAAEEGVSLLDSEVIGLLPAAALLEVADHIGSASFHPAERRVDEAAGWLRIRRFDPDSCWKFALRRLAKARPTATDRCGGPACRRAPAVRGDAPAARLQQDDGGLVGDGRDGDLQAADGLQLGHAHLLEELVEVTAGCRRGLGQGQWHDHGGIELA